MDHPNVFELRRELEVASQKQKEQKAYSSDNEEAAELSTRVEAVGSASSVASGAAWAR